MNKRGIFVILVLVSLVFVFGCSVDKEVKETEDMYQRGGFFKIVKGEKGEAPSTPITVSLSIIPTTPNLNEITEITATVSSILDAPNTKVEIILPNGVNLVSGNLVWEGDLEADVPVSFSANIIFTKAENIRIETVAMHAIDEENSWGDMDVIYLYYSESQEVETGQVGGGG